MDLKRLRVKPVINKLNKQINISLPKKQIPEDILDEIMQGKEIRLRFDD